MPESVSVALSVGVEESLVNAMQRPASTPVPCGQRGVVQLTSSAASNRQSTGASGAVDSGTEGQREQTSGVLPVGQVDPGLQSSSLKHGVVQRQLLEVSCVQ